MALKYKDEHSIHGSDISISLLEDMDYLKKAIAYVMRNPMAAGMHVVPTGYRWSSSNLYFADMAFLTAGFRRLGDLSISAKRRLFMTKVLLPDEFLVDRHGVIFPGSYVDYTAVENIFGFPGRMLFSLSSTKEIEVELHNGILAKSSYKDTELRVSMEIISADRFCGRKYEMLKIEDRYRIAADLRKRYGVGLKQLARVTSLSLESLKSLISNPRPGK